MKNFVFDLYGTLVDVKTDETGEKVLKRTDRYFSSLGVKNFNARYADLCSAADGGGDTEINLLSVFSDIMCAPECEVVHIAERYRELTRRKLKVYSGVRSLLENLKRGGAYIYLLSNAQSCFTVGELKKLKLMQVFDGVELSSDFGFKKPSEKFFKHLIGKYSLDVADTVYVGNDIKADILGAKVVGLNTAYVKSNISPLTDSVEQAEKYADFATDNFKELSRYLLSKLN